MTELIDKERDEQVYPPPQKIQYCTKRRTTNRICLIQAR